MRGLHLRAALVLLLCLVAGLALAARSCPQCGTSNPDNAKFCKNCGYEFPARPRPEPQPRPALRVEVDVQPGVVTITSTPEGATVTVDDRRRGATPLRLTDLTPGKHELKCTLAGYRGYEGAFSARPSQGSVRVFVNPSGAVVFFDGRNLGPAPDSGLVVGGLDLGGHTVEAQFGDLPRQGRQVTLSEDQLSSEVRIQIAQDMGFLQVESDPLGANLTINGGRVGRTNYFGVVKPATYRVELSLGGYKEWRRDVSVVRGDTALVSAVLSPVRAPRYGLLVAGLVGIAGGAAAAVLGQVSYQEYVDARPPDYPADRITALRRQTILCDWVRNIAIGVGALGVGAFFAF